MQQELCTGLACAHKPGGLGSSPCPPEQSLPWLYFCREQCAIAKIVHEECCLPHSPRGEAWLGAESGCLPSCGAGPAPCSARPSLRQLDLCQWLWVLLYSGLHCLAQDHVALLRVMLHGSGPCCTAQDHVMLLGSTLQSAGPHCMLLHGGWLLGRKGLVQSPACHQARQHDGVKLVMGLNSSCQARAA